MTQISGFGVLVLGPSGSGKTTFCNGLGQFFTAIHRKHVLVNLDPANESLSYIPDIDIKELVQLEEVMENLHLGYIKN